MNTPWWDDADDASRLVRADALTAAGNPRGEFVVLQCTSPNSPRIAELWNAHHLTWLFELGLPQYTWSVKRPGFSTALYGAKSGLEVWNAQFERGFLTRLWGPKLSEELEARLVEGATLRHLELEHWDLDTIIARTQRFQLEALGVLGATSSTREQLETLLTSPMFERLGEFLFNAGTDDADARAATILELAGRAPRLVRLSFTGALGNKVVSAVTRFAWTRRLTAIEISSPDATEEIAPLLAHLPLLESLTLNVHRATPRIAEVLLAHPKLKRARIRTSAPTMLEDALGARLRDRLGPEALVRF